MLKKFSTATSILCACALVLSACAQPAATDAPVTPAAAATSTTAPQAAATSTATEPVQATATTAATATTEATAAPEATATTAAGGTPGADSDTLTSVRVTTAPTLDGQGDDDAWANAPVFSIETAGGANESDTTVTIQSVYDDENVYFLVTWADPTNSFLRGPWEKQEDGTWMMLESEDNRGSDENEFYEDKISFIWSINNSIRNFETQGCFTACHAGENSDVKPYGNKYTSSPEEKGDIWHWKSVRNVGQVDDQFLDNTGYSAETPGAGRKSDKRDGGGYVDNATEDGTAPAFMVAGGGDKSGGPGFITDEEKVPFDDSLFQAGDRLPSIVVSPFTGDRGDISAEWNHDGEKWTLEISRALDTGSETDVQFEDLSQTYYFGVATFDNAQVRHAFHPGAIAFVFQQE